MMVRRGITLVEVLVALAVFMVVASGGMYLIFSQNRSWKLQSDKAAMELMAKCSMDELTRAVRMTGSGLPNGLGGFKVYGGGEEKVTFVMNENGGVGMALGGEVDLSQKILRIAVEKSSSFSDLGYARLDLMVPPEGSHDHAASTARSFTLGILDRTAMGSGCGDSIILDISPLMAAPYGWDSAGDIRPLLNGSIYNIDSLTYHKVKDTLYLKRNLQDSTIFATGIDSFQVRYFHPVAGWSDSLEGTDPVNNIQKVSIRLVVRSSSPNGYLRSMDSSSRGYQLTRMEAVVGVRNTELVNH